MPMPILAPVLSELSLSLVGNDADDDLEGVDVVDDGDTGVVTDVDKVDEVSKEMVVGAEVVNFLLISERLLFKPRAETHQFQP